VDVHTTLLAEALGFLLLMTSSLCIHFASPKYIIHCNVFVLIGHDDKLYAAAAVKVEDTCGTRNAYESREPFELITITSCLKVEKT